MHKYSRNMTTSYNKNIQKVVLANRVNGTWISIPMKWKEVLDTFIDKGIQLNEFITLFEDNGNKKSFEELVHKTFDAGFIVNINDEEKDEIDKISFAITERCNLNCAHCCIDAKFNPDINSDMATGDVISIIDKIIKFSPKNINLSGGEPLMRSDFIDILRHIKRNYTGKVTLSTNGLLITDKIIQELVDSIYSFDISVDGADEESCSRIRGSGVFDKVVTVVKNLKNCGAKKITLSMIDFGGSSLREKFKELNKELGTDPMIRVLSPAGRGVNLKTKLEYLEKLYRPKKIEDSQLKNLSKGLRGCSCGALKKQILINYDGGIYPCGLLIKDEYKMGNINEYSTFDQLLSDINSNKVACYKNLLDLEPNNLLKCKECSVNFACWNCLHEADLLKESTDLISKRCELKKSNLEKIVWGVHNDC